MVAMERKIGEQLEKIKQFSALSRTRAFIDNIVATHQDNYPTFNQLDIINSAIEEKENVLEEASKLVIDMSSPNIGKAMSFSQFRSTLIGNSLAKIAEYLNREVIRINHLGDNADYLGGLLRIVDDWIQANGEKLDNLRLNDLFGLTQPTDWSINDGEVEDSRDRAWYLKLQAKDEIALQYWEKIKEISYLEFEKIYMRLNINFEEVAGESSYQDLNQETETFLENLGLLVNQEQSAFGTLNQDGIPVPIFKRSHGGYSYLMNDITTARYRYEKYSPNAIWYIVGCEQTVHFEQLKVYLKAAGFKWANQLEHIKYGALKIKNCQNKCYKGLVGDELVSPFDEQYLAIRHLSDEQLGTVIYDLLSQIRTQDININIDNSESTEYQRLTDYYINLKNLKHYNVPNVNLQERNSSEETLQLLLTYKEIVFELALSLHEPAVLAAFLADIFECANKVFNASLNEEKSEIYYPLLCKTISIFETILNCYGISKLIA